MRLSANTSWRICCASECASCFKSNPAEKHFPWPTRTTAPTSASSASAAKPQAELLEQGHIDRVDRRTVHRERAHGAERIDLERSSGCPTFPSVSHARRRRVSQPVSLTESGRRGQQYTKRVRGTWSRNEPRADFRRRALPDLHGIRSCDDRAAHSEPTNRRPNRAAEAAVRTGSWADCLSGGRDLRVATPQRANWAMIEPSQNIPPGGLQRAVNSGLITDGWLRLRETRGVPRLPRTCSPSNSYRRFDHLEAIHCVRARARAALPVDGSRRKEQARAEGRIRGARKRRRRKVRSRTGMRSLKTPRSKRATSTSTRRAASSCWPSPKIVSKTSFS